MSKDPIPGPSTDAEKPKTSAGGFFIALGGIAGAILGVIMGQPSIGLLAGLALGGLAALVIWLRDR